MAKTPEPIEYRGSPNTALGMEVPLNAWVPTAALRWKGDVLQQEFTDQAGRYQWRELPWVCP